MELLVYNTEGQEVDRIEVREDVFAVPANTAVIHQALVRQLANSRQGTVDTKTRGEVAGTTRKLFAQKHTGRARQGTRRSPTRRGGGLAFGPHPRDYSQAMPKRMRRLALRGLLSEKVRSQELTVLDGFNLAQPRTKAMLSILGALRVTPPALLVTEQAELVVVRSARNLPGVKTLPAALLNVVDLLKHRQMVMTVGAVRRAESIWGIGEAGA